MSIKEETQRSSYIVLDWAGPPKVWRLRILKVTAKQVQVERTVASHFAAVLTIPQFEQDYAPTPEQAIAKWRANLEVEASGLELHASVLRDQARTTPPMNEGDK